MNVLILSAGTRNKIVQYAKKTFGIDGYIVATDNSKYAPSLYEADKYYIVPRIDDPKYLDIVIKICRDEKIDVVFSLIDPELELLSKNESKFLAVGATPIVSPLKWIQIAFDKMQMHNFCIANNINTIKSFDSLEKIKYEIAAKKISYPLFAKPKRGSASKNIMKIENEEQLDAYCKKENDYIIQEYMKGFEIGCDVYIDSMSGEVVDIFTKRKILMKSGETDKAISFKDDKLFDFIKKFISKSGYKYNIDIDVYVKNGEYLLSEVNPRFGGGYPHAYACGCNFFDYIKTNMYKKKNESRVGHYSENIVMMKYPEVFIKEMI